MNARFLLLLVAAVAPAAAAPAKAHKVRTVEGITEYKLDNGLQVLLFPDPTQSTITVNVTYLVGSRLEGYGETGMAHLLEHMMFKGSPRHPKVWDELQARGADNNASTWYDRTNYFETLPNKADNLAWALEMEADRMVNANIAQADLASEFSVVRNEFEIGETSPDRILSERMWSTAYLWHNYGKSTIGSRADIEKVPATSLRRFYKKYYRPDNAVLLVTGKLDAAPTLALIQRTFGGLTNPSAPLEPTYTTEPVQDGERVVTLRRNGDVQEVGLVYHTAAAADPDYVATAAIGELLTAEPSGRLYSALVKPGLASSVRATVLPLHDPGTIEIMATVPVGKSLDVVRDKMIAVVEGLGKAKISDEELARIQARGKKEFKHAFANSGELGIEISELIAAGDWRLWFLHRDQLARLTTGDVSRVAAAYLVPANRTLGLFVPTKAPVRAPAKDTPDIAKVVAGYQGAPPEFEGEKFEATVANIERRTVRKTLGNGMKTAILAKQTRGHVVQARLTLRYAGEAELTGTANRVAAAALHELLGRGTRHHTFQQIEDQLDLLEAELELAPPPLVEGNDERSDPGTLDVTVTTTRDHLAAVLALVDEIVREPVFPPDQVDIALKQRISELEDGKSDPISLGFREVARALAPYPASHPLYVPKIDEQIAQLKALKIGDVKKLVARFGMSHAELTIVGDVDRAAIEPWIESTWGTWRSPRPWQRIARAYQATQGGEQVIDVPDKATGMIAVAEPIALKDDDADVPALVAANYTLGGGGFVSRLLTRLRQKDGLSYFAFSTLQLHPLDATTGFFALGALNPENARKGMAAMREEIGKLVAGGVTADELAAAKTGLLTDFERSLSSDSFVLRQLSDGLLTGRTMEFWAQRNAAIGQLTVEQVNATIKRQLKPDQLVRVIAGDQKKM
ncbi:MAG TPA: pitrilysin family protein [Kofleriaceae bacterium]|nr:pitrilysin family protein [Kofleriaceae bacterium]